MNDGLLNTISLRRNSGYLDRGRERVNLIWPNMFDKSHYMSSQAFRFQDGEKILLVFLYSKISTKKCISFIHLNKERWKSMISCLHSFFFYLIHRLEGFFDRVRQNGFKKKRCLTYIFERVIYWLYANIILHIYSSIIEKYWWYENTIFHIWNETWKGDTTTKFRELRRKLGTYIVYELRTKVEL